MCDSPDESEPPGNPTLTDDTGGQADLKDYYACDRCAKRFTTKKYLRSHLKTIHESPRLFICPLCGKQLAREKGLNQHVKTIHEGNWAVFCSICGKGFINRCRYKKHCTNVHERQNRFPCSICEQGFSSEPLRENHMELVHGDVNNGREATAKLENLHPVDQRTPQPIPNYSQISSSLTVEPSSSDDQPLDLSIRRSKSPASEHELAQLRPSYGATLRSVDHSQQSFAEVSSTSTNRYSCTYCAKSFASKEYLRLHEATIHKGTKAFVCDVCGKHFSVHQALRKHHMIQHEGGKPYRCHDCVKDFRTRAALRSHRATSHTKTTKILPTDASSQ